MVHQRDAIRVLIQQKVSGPKAFQWLSQMRFYFDPKQKDVLQQLSIHMANAKFNYGFEYLGVQDKLVHTPLTDRCYLTMTQALERRLGGSPFGNKMLVLVLTIGQNRNNQYENQLMNIDKSFFWREIYVYQLNIEMIWM